MIFRAYVVHSFLVLLVEEYLKNHVLEKSMLKNGQSGIELTPPGLIRITGDLLFSHRLSNLYDSEREFFSPYFSIVSIQKRIKIWWDQSKTRQPAKKTEKWSFYDIFSFFPSKHFKFVTDIKAKEFSSIRFTNISATKSYKDIYDKTLNTF